MKKMQKKFKKKPGTAPVPGFKVFFRVKIVVKNTLGPGTGTVPEILLNFFCIFFIVCMYILRFKKKFGGQPTLLLSNKILI